MKLFQKRTNGKIKAEETSSAQVQAPAADQTDAEIAAVIALAVNLYLKQVREYEQANITIQKAIKPYSPWSSKIYGLRQQPMFIPGLKSRLK